MPLRDSEHIRERRPIYIEPRHVVRAVVAVAAIAGSTIDTDTLVVVVT